LQMLLEQVRARNAYASASHRRDSLSRMERGQILTVLADGLRAEVT
jgi:hypothetical protein